MTLYPTFNAVSFGKLHYLKQWFAHFDIIKGLYWGIMVATEVRKMC